MKKLISFLLVLALCFSCFLPSSFAIGTDASKTDDSDKAQKLLMDIGIIAEGFDSQKLITRGDFSYYLCKLLNIDQLVSKTQLPFGDVGAEHKYYNSIATLYDWGIISASLNFRPDDIITQSEALKMAVVTLSYAFLA